MFLARTYYLMSSRNEVRNAQCRIFIDVDIRLVGPVKIGAAGENKTVFDGQFLELPAFIMIIWTSDDMELEPTGPSSFKEATNASSLASPR